jgi:hypothetical protein
MKNRPQRLIFFVVVWLTMFSCVSGEAQNLLKNTQSAPDFKHLFLPGSTHTAVASAGNRRVMQDPVNLSWQNLFAGSLNAGYPYAIPSDIYYIQSGFFCKREWDLEKATHIPFRFRVGSLADCNAMEGKH